VSRNKEAWNRTSTEAVMLCKFASLTCVQRRHSFMQATHLSKHRVNIFRYVCCCSLESHAVDRDQQSCNSVRQ
jgi:hypothetical protein